MKPTYSSSDLEVHTVEAMPRPGWPAEVHFIFMKSQKRAIYSTVDKLQAEYFAKYPDEMPEQKK